VNRIRSMRRQIEEWERRAGSQPDLADVARAGRAVREQLGAIEDELIQVRVMEDDDTLRFPIKLNIKLAELFDTVASADAAPTRQAREVFAELAARVDAQLQRLDEVVERDVAGFNALVRDARVPAVSAEAEAPRAGAASSFAGRR
jgi:hypothetical protein